MFKSTIVVLAVCIAVAMARPSLIAPGLTLSGPGILTAPQTISTTVIRAAEPQIQLIAGVPQQIIAAAPQQLILTQPQLVGAPGPISSTQIVAGPPGHPATIVAARTL